MSDFIGHECGLAMVRLRQPISYYRDRYGDALWGLRRLYLLMEKQHNRGQDGVGMAVAKFDMPPGESFLERVRSRKRNALERLFDTVIPKASKLNVDPASDDVSLKRNIQFLGEVYLGHLRYGTHSGNRLEQCHPYVRKHNIASKNLAIAGNFNMTNAVELFQKLVEYGLNPTGDSDTQVVLERIGYQLDREHDHLRATFGPESFRGLEGRELAIEVSNELDLIRILQKAARDWDGGYLFAGLIGNGDAFVCRDPAGIRPGYFYFDEEVLAVASERAALANVFDVAPEQVEPVGPGKALVVKRNGTIRHEPITEPLELRQCTFERIYFSRGNDPLIYEQRKALGRNLASSVLEAIDDRVEDTVFAFIPNTAEVAYMGLVEEIGRLSRSNQIASLWDRISAQTATREDLEQLLNGHVRTEKIAHKDQRLRTFITHDDHRRDLVLHIYDITRGIVKPTDTLVVVDDSIVRGTTLRESIITILSRLRPKRIIIVSSAPPILYPDCYGIDMSQLGRFIAFEAAVGVIRDRGDGEMLEEVERRCEAQAGLPPHRMQNHVKALCDSVSLEQISAKVAQLTRPAEMEWSCPVDVIYQSIEGLHTAMPGFTGDWYFTGEYPTPGGYRVLNQSYLNWRKQVDVRAYE
jgi:amidophosphoribosyltransferase